MLHYIHACCLLGLAIPACQCLKGVLASFSQLTNQMAIQTFGLPIVIVHCLFDIRVNFLK